MARNNGSSSVTEETMESVLKTIKVLETLEAMQAGMKQNEPRGPWPADKKGIYALAGSHY
jgi:hypothetical protein